MNLIVKNFVQELPWLFLLISVFGLTTALLATEPREITLGIDLAIIGLILALASALLIVSAELRRERRKGRSQ